MDIKEIALKVADSLRNKIDGISHMQSNQGLVAFAEALIESYKAELLKEVGEPVAELVLCISANGLGTEWRTNVSAWWSAVEPERRAKVFTSDQVAAAILKVTKPLKEEVARYRGKSIANAERTEAYLYENQELRAQLATAQEEILIERSNGDHWRDAYSKWVNTDESARRLIELQEQLAAEQLNNKLLREALEAVIKVHGYESGIPVEAISTQTSTEALDQYVAEKVREAGKFDGWKTNPYTKVLETSIKQLTKQRDLAVEALIGIENFAVQPWAGMATEALLSIKESEAK